MKERYCGYCEHNDGNVYTSLPPQVRCKLTGRFRRFNDTCDPDAEALELNCTIENDGTYETGKGDYE